MRQRLFSVDKLTNLTVFTFPLSKLYESFISVSLYACSWFLLSEQVCRSVSIPLHVVKLPVWSFPSLLFSYITRPKYFSCRAKCLLETSHLLVSCAVGQATQIFSADKGCDGVVAVTPSTDHCMCVFLPRLWNSSS